MGLVSGPAVETSPRWDDAELESRAGDRLERELVELYEALASRFEAGTLPPAQGEVARHALLVTAARLGDVLGEADEEGDLPRTLWMRRLWTQALRRLPLLWPQGDRRVSFEEAARRGLDVRGALDAMAAFQRFLDRPPRRGKLEGPVEVSVEVAVGGVHGEVGIPRGRARGRRVDLHLSDRLLASRPGALGLPLEPFEAVLASDALTPTADWRGVEEDAALEAARQALWGATGALVDAALERLSRADGSAPEGLRAFLVSVVAALFPTPRFLRALETNLAAAASPTEALAVYAGILRLGKGRSVGSVHRALGWLRKRGERPTVEAVRRYTTLRDPAPNPRRLWPVPGDPGEGSIEGPAARLGALLEAALFPVCFGGAPVSFLRVVEALQAEGRVRWLEGAPDDVAVDPGAHLVLSFPPAQSGLLTVGGRSDAEDAILAALGRRAESAEPWLQTQRGLARFHARPTEAVQLGPEAVLVQVPVAAGEVTGVAALPLEMPGETEQLVVRLYRGGRFVGVHRERAVAGLVAALDHPALPLTDDARGPQEGEALAALLAAARGARPALLETLAERWPGLEGADLEVARSAVLGSLAGALDVEEPDWGHPLVERLAALEVFDFVDGGRCGLATLREVYEAEGRLRYVPAWFRTGASEAGRGVVVVGSWALGQLTRVFAKVVDHSSELEDAAAGDARRRAAPPLPDPEPSTLLARVPVEGAGLEGALWLPPGRVADGVALGQLHPGENGNCYGPSHPS